jgi:hypothetical protein
MPEQIWILLLVLAVVLFNFVTGFLARRRERDAADEARKSADTTPSSRRPAARARVTPPRIPDSPARPSGEQPKRDRLRWRRGDLRRAIVLMTLLGPPRALDDDLPPRRLRR